MVRGKNLMFYIYFDLDSKHILSIVNEQNNSNILINGYKQSGVLHYVEDEFLTDDVVQWLEERV